MEWQKDGANMAAGSMRRRRRPIERSSCSRTISFELFSDSPQRDIVYAYCLIPGIIVELDIQQRKPMIKEQRLGQDHGLTPRQRSL